MSTQPEAVKSAPPPAVMIDAIAMQLEDALESMAVPDYVEKSAREFIAALQKWSGGGN